MNGREQLYRLDMDSKLRARTLKCLASWRVALIKCAGADAPRLRLPAKA